LRFASDDADVRVHLTMLIALLLNESRMRFVRVTVKGAAVSGGCILKVIQVVRSALADPWKGHAAQRIRMIELL